MCKNKFSLSRITLYLAIIIISLISIVAIQAQTTSTKHLAIILNIDGAISPATQDYIHRGIDKAVEDNAELVILRLDTPGGLDKSMRKIIKDILASPIPIVTYVAPSGARAASAGTYILYASHIAAMAPGTNLGAATPVQIGGGGFPGTQPEKKDEKSKDDAKKQDSSPPKDAMKQKIINDAIAYIKSLAQLRGRNADWAVKAVKEAASLPAQEALKLNVINVVANNIPDLLKQINGYQVKINNQTIQLNTSDMVISTIQPDWRTKLLAVITDPSVAYILLLIGIYGIFFEFANPGFIVPGVIGAIALVLALYALQLLPINYAGLALIILGIAFLAAEAFVPSFGILGFGGIIAFIAGSILLIEPAGIGLGINWYVIFGMAAINAIFFFFVIGLAMRSYRRKVVSGGEELIGMIGIAKDDFTNDGWIKLHGESWHAQADVAINKDQSVKVISRDGLKLKVEPVSEV